MWVEGACQATGPSWWCLQDVRAAELRQQLTAARDKAREAEAHATAAEERQRQLEAVLNENHAALQQRNAELALVMKVRLGRGWVRCGV